MRTAALSFVVLALAASACGGGAPAPRAQAPTWEAKDQTKCAAHRSRARPLIVEWPSPDRGALEVQARRGIVAVRYEGCEMEVLRQCKVAGQYAYGGVTRKEDHVAIRTADDLYASVPVHAAALEAKLAQAGRLDVSMTVVGSFDADKHIVERADLAGDCARATHFIAAMTVGAFEFSAGGANEARGGATVLGAGVSAGTSSSHEVLDRDGNAAACAAAKATDTAPPEGCGGLLRVEVAPITEPPAPAATPYVFGEGPAPSSPRRPAVVDNSPPPPPPGPPRGGTQRAIGNTLTGVGTLSVITGLSTGFVALILKSNLDDSCPDKVCPTAKQSSVDSYRTVANITTWTMGLGLLAIAGGLTLYYTAPTGPSVGATFGPNGAALGGKF